mmetsp:Transcript_83490/g.232937  ORF Transcript_83490/g.232937 Transcript_83490/m.232937 type:complete len:200 (+) Transcript_83490:706-1305(+)
MRGVATTLARGEATENGDATEIRPGLVGGREHGPEPRDSTETEPGTEDASCAGVPSCTTSKFSGRNAFAEPSSKRTLHQPSLASASTIVPSLPFKSHLDCRPETRTMWPIVPDTPLLLGEPFAEPQDSDTTRRARGLPPETSSHVKFSGLSSLAALSPSSLTSQQPSAGLQSSTVQTSPLSSGCVWKSHTRARDPGPKP